LLIFSYKKEELTIIKINNKIFNINIKNALIKLKKRKILINYI